MNCSEGEKNRAKTRVVERRRRGGGGGGVSRPRHNFTHPDSLRPSTASSDFSKINLRGRQSIVPVDEFDCCAK